MSMLDIAVDYARGGAEVLPLHTPVAGGCSCRGRDCRHPGKHPRVMRGLHDASSDVDTVTRWWLAWPEANIGVRPRPGQVVVDVDPRNGGAVQLVAMQERFVQLPATRTAQTGGLGWHLWFGYDGEAVKELAPGIDIKTHDGYVVVPPSLHATGNAYIWTNPGPIVDAPDYLRSLLARPPIIIRPACGHITEARMSGLVRFVAEAPEGRLNINLYWAACRCHEYGVDPAPVVDAAVAAGHPRRAAERTAESATKAPSGREGGG